ncbi:MAG: citramalate synthase [Gemmatimonadetes bacterium]|jgi:2-isopropylmalate synthase|nr:citramalate synthase [Gemmatimonadota bacterium]
MSSVPKMVEIYDSTLRDGAQAEGIAYSLEDKLLIARRLDRLGVHYIEGGWPNPTNPKDLAFFEEVKKLKLQARVTAFGSTRRPGNRPEEDDTLITLLKAETESIAIFGKSWTLHATQVLRTTLEENLRMIEDSVAFLVERGREVVYDAEHFFDGYKADPDYAVETLLAAERGGARILVLCDTNGGTLTSELIRIVESVIARIGTPFGIHAHNDAGVGVANSLAAVELGAVQVQGTFNGYGERCGNANLCSIIPNLELKMESRTIGRDKLQELMNFSRFLSEIANVHHDHRQPFVGESAFAHKGGAHVDGVMKVAHSFEHVEPESVGNERRFLVSDQSGGGTIVSKISHIIPGIDKKDPLVGKVLEKVKQQEHGGYQYEAAEGSFELMVRRALGTYEDLFKLVSFRTINRKTGEAAEESEAIVKIEVDGQIYHTVAEGDGPVNALDQALRKGLDVVFPSIRQVHLEDYKVRVLASGDGTAAKVRVLIESSDGQDAWGTVGVSENIIEASWIALADSLHFKLMKDALAIDEAMGVEGNRAKG